MQNAPTFLPFLPVLPSMGCLTKRQNDILARACFLCNTTGPLPFYSLKGSRLRDEDRAPQEELQRLVEQASKGDAGAFGKLYDLYLDMVYRYVYYKVGAQAEAEDLTSQVFVKAWEAMPRYRWREIPFSHWLMRMARNSVIDHYRTSKPQGELNEEVVSRELGPQAEYLRVERSKEMEAAIRQLPEDQRTVIVLRFIEELDYAQIAAVTGKSQGSLRVTQFRGLAALRKILERGEK